MLRAAVVALLLAVLQVHASARPLAEAGQAGSNGRCKPRQVHVALTGDPTQLKVSWKTKDADCPSSVEYGLRSSASTDPGSITSTGSSSNPAPRLTLVGGSVAQYDSSDYCAAPARNYDVEPQYLHHVTLTDLRPGAEYVYRVAGGRDVTVRAPPRPGPDGSFTFLVYGDMGESTHGSAKSPGAADTQAAVLREVEDGAELVLHVGDISYANGRQEVWDAFMEDIEPFASRVPYMVAVGNHEYDWRKGRPEKDPSGADAPFDPDWGNFGNDSGGECGVATTKQFAMPDLDDFGYWPMPNCSTSSITSVSSNTVDNPTDASSSSESSGGVGSGSACAGAAAWAAQRRNPTLGPHGAAASAGRPLPPPQANPTASVAASASSSSSSSGPSTAPGAAAASSGVAGPGSGPGSSAGANKGHHGGEPNPPFWYSFSYGSVHFTVLSTEHDASPGSQQYRWVEKDLMRVDRCRTPWLVVAMHRPMYVVFPHKSNRIVGDHLRAQLEPLFNEFEVDMVVAGHVHSYARTCNVLDERCIDEDDGGMTHVTVGCAGRKLSDVEHEQPEWLDAAEVHFGFGRITVRDDHSLTFDYIRSSDGEVHDSVTIKNTREVRRGCNYAAFGTSGSSGSSTAAEHDKAPAKPDAAAATAGGCSGGGGSCGGRRAGSGGWKGGAAEEQAQLVLRSATEGSHVSGAVLAA